MSLSTIAARLDPVQPATSLYALCEQHYSLPPLNSLRDAVARHTHAARQEHRFFAYNTFLMDLPGRGRKPAVEYRDREIGQYTARNTDITCFSEVWHEEERSDLLSEWPETAQMAHKSGRSGVTNLIPMRKSAGLVTVSRSMEIAALHFYAYENESGADASAMKGILLTAMKTGLRSANTPSSLNFYNTHLNASGDTKIIQILEVANFIWTTMDRVEGDLNGASVPGLNGNILAGDFNIARASTTTYSTNDLAASGEGQRLPAHIRNAINHRVTAAGELTNEVVPRKTGYQLLTNVLAQLGFQDLWAHRNGTPGFSSDLTKNNVINTIAQPADDNPAYCNDNIDTAAAERLPNPPDAIDYIFATPTTAQMAFTMDFTRPRRPRTVRPDSARDRDEISFMSDHLGIATKILISPKAA